nr:hypothetical protein [uncultured Prevotella sp.]
MALNKNLKEKLALNAAGDKAAYNAIINLLEGVDEGKQLKRILEPILKTL